MELWKKIEKQLKIKKMTIYRLSKISGVNEGALYELSKGRAKDMVFTKVCQIADALEVSLEDLRPDKENLNDTYD